MLAARDGEPVDVYLAPPGENVRLRARAAGPPEAPALLLLHGLGENADVWWDRGWAGALSHCRRVIAFDARGHGASSKPHQADRYGETSPVADALAVLDALGCAEADVVGYSMGGWTALVLAAAAPARVRSLTVGGASAVGQSLQPLRRALAAGLVPLLAAIERQCGQLSAPVRERFLANDAAALAAVCAADRPALVDRLASFAAPARFFVAERDPLRPAVEAGAQRLGWPCAVVLGYGHFDLALSGAALPVVAGFLSCLDRSGTRTA
jgi:pimeloyl-ACP methyl ester carboxylesterase